MSGDTRDGDPVERTIGWYDREAAQFAASTENADLAGLRARFLRYVSNGGRILDAGCGVGRDALAFAEAGYSVVAFDASEAMVQAAKAKLPPTCPVHQMRFEEMAWHDEFDGVWACASLLHVRASDFRAVADRIIRSLRPSGVWYASFKHGEGERWHGDRFFLDQTEASLGRALQGVAAGLIENWVTTDVRPGREAERWTNCLVRRT